MIAVVDAGNSTVNVGLVENGKVIFKTFIETKKAHKGLDLPRKFKPEVAIFSSVVPEINDVLTDSLKKWTGKNPMQLTYKTASGVKILYRNPSELGADRITHAYFIKKFVRGPSVVVDIGTAITIDFIGGDGTFAGGAILASPETILHGLAQKTSRLKEIDLSMWPQTFIGRSTSECLRIGLLHGTVGSILYITESIENEVEMDVKKFLTGGGGERFKEKLVDFHYNPDLNLLGLAAALEEIQKTERKL